MIDSSVFATWAAGEETYWWFVGRRAILRRVVDAVAPVREGCRSLVDIGCGVGSTLTAFHPDFDCIGYDPSAEAIAFACSRHPAFDLRVGGAAEAGEALGRADVVLLNDVIEHVEDDRALVASVLDPMRPGAVLVVTVPADMRLWSPHDERVGHHRRYDVAGLERAFAGQRARPLLVSHFMSRLYPVVRAVRIVSRLRGRAAGDAGIDMKLLPSPINGALAWLLAGESDRIAAAARGAARPYGHGVSLIGAYCRA